MLNIQRTRPLGITIIAVIVAIYGILNIIAGIALMGASTTIGVISLVLGILDLVLAWGLWTLQRWAFWATALIEALSLINGIFGMMYGGGVSAILSIVIPLIILIYLFADRNVRAAFRT